MKTAAYLAFAPALIVLDWLGPARQRRDLLTEAEQLLFLILGELAVGLPLGCFELFPRGMAAALLQKPYEGFHPDPLPRLSSPPRPSRSRRRPLAGSWGPSRVRGGVKVCSLF